MSESNNEIDIKTLYDKIDSLKDEKKDSLLLKPIYKHINSTNIYNVLLHCIDNEYYVILIEIINNNIVNIYEILYKCLIHSLIYNNTYVTKLLLRNYSEHITNRLCNTIVLNILKNHPLIQITLILNNLRLTDLNSDVVDYILKNMRTPEKQPLLYVLLSSYTRKIKNTQAVKMYLNSFEKDNESIKKLIRSKMENYIDESTWKVYCIEFNKLTYNDLVLYLMYKGVYDYKQTDISNIPQRELCYLLRTKKLTIPDIKIIPDSPTSKSSSVSASAFTSRSTSKSSSRSSSKSKLDDIIEDIEDIEEEEEKDISINFNDDRYIKDLYED